MVSGEQCNVSLAGWQRPTCWNRAIVDPLKVSWCCPIPFFTIEDVAMVWAMASSVVTQMIQSSFDTAPRSTVLDNSRKDVNRTVVTASVQLAMFTSGPRSVAVICA